MKKRPLKKYLIFFVCALALVFQAPGAYALTEGNEYASPEAPSADDGSVAQDVRETLQNNTALRSVASDVSVDAKNGVVTLTGTVPTREDKAAVEQKVKECDGVTQVDDQLRLAN